MSDNHFLIRRDASLLKCLENRELLDLRHERIDHEVLGVSVPGPAHPEKSLSGVLLLQFRNNVSSHICVPLLPIHKDGRILSLC